MHEGSPPRWCHLVWTTARRRPGFKIAAVAGFCERAVRGACGTLGWMVDTVTILPDQVQLLIAVPNPLPRQDVCRTLRQAVTRTLRASSLPFPTRAHLWEDPSWCAALASAAAVTVVRRQLRMRNQHDRLVGEQPASGFDDIRGLGQDEVFKRGRVG